MYLNITRSSIFIINLGTHDTTGDGPRDYGESGDDAFNSDTSDDDGKFKKTYLQYYHEYNLGDLIFSPIVKIKGIESDFCQYLE